MKKIVCLFKGHVKPSQKRKKEIKETIYYMQLDVYGSSAFKNIGHIHELEKELISCTRCKGYL